MLLKRKTEKKLISLMTGLVLLILSLFITVPASAAESFELHLLDVGQGLSVLVEADGHFLLYDGGGRSSSSYVVSYLKQQGVENLDYTVVSHYDEDHISGVVGALNVFGCSTILGPDYSTDTNIYQSYLEASTASGAGIVYPSQGDYYLMGNATITVVGPSSYDSDIENDRSVAIRIQYGSTSYLICGDAQEDEEEEIANSGLDIASDIYVINHHGSADSSGFYFLNKVAPTYALLSCSEDNSYGHPALEAMERLQSEGVSLFRTDKQGEIVVYSDGSSIWFNQDPCNDFSAGTSQTADSGTRSVPAPGTTDAGTDGGTTYVCNINTYKFHYSYCDSVDRMKEENKLYTYQNRDELIAQGYSPCQNCNP